MDNDDVIPVTARLPRDDEGWDEPQRLYRYPPALLEHLRKMPRGDRYTVEHVKDRTVEIARALERQGRPPPPGFADLLRALLKPKPNLDYGLNATAPVKDKHGLAYHAAVAYEGANPEATVSQTAKYIARWFTNQKSAESFVRRCRERDEYRALLLVMRDKEA